MQIEQNKTVRWADMCRSYRMAGIMRDFSKSECLRVARLIDERVREGKVVRVRRGLYRMNDDAADGDGPPQV